MLADIEILMYRQGMIKMWLDSFSNIYCTVRSAEERKTLILSAIVDKQRFFKEVLQTGFSDAGVEVATLSLGGAVLLGICCFICLLFRRTLAI